ncbi:MAG: sugar transporter substrate-binding protein [Subtercola sp.]|nr:sugar transporter substrate-binding protein [Subtercola sp.]
MSIAQSDTEFLGTLGDYMDQQIRAEGWQMIPIVSAESKPDKQLSDIQNLLAQQPDVLIIDAADSAAVVPGIEMATKQGVAVYTVDVPAAGGKVVANVRTDNVQAGAIAAQIVLDSVMKQSCWGAGTCKVLELQGRLGSAAADDRSRGIQEFFAKYPQIALTSRPTDWDPQKALDETQSYVTANPDLAGIVTAAEWVHPGIISILNSAGLTAKAGEPGHVAIAGVDGTPFTLGAIREGTVTGSASQPLRDYVNGLIGIVKAVQLDGTQLAVGDATFNGVAGTFVQIPSGLDFQLPAIAVTAKNVDDQTLWGNLVKSN